MKVIIQPGFEGRVKVDRTAGWGGGNVIPRPAEVPVRKLPGVLHDVRTPKQPKRVV